MPATKTIKVVAISDLHGKALPEIPECDLLLIGGDICPDYYVDAKYHQGQWLDSTFRYWLETAPAKKIIGVAGNHDFVFEGLRYDLPLDLPWTYLEDSGTEWEGLKIWGSPWQPPFGNWAFNAETHLRKSKWEAIPEDTNILVLHGPPYSYGDKAPRPRLQAGYEHTGCKFLLKRLKQLHQCKLAIFGHIHEGRGEWQLGNMTLANVTLLDGRYREIHQPWTHELAA